MIKKLFAAGILVILLLPLHGYAQDFVELGQAGYRYSFKTSSESDTARAVYGARLNIMVPLKLSDKTYFLPGFRYWQYRIDPGENLNFYLFQLGLQTSISEDWTLQLVPLLRSGIYQNASFGSGFQFGLLATANHQINEKLMLGYGFYTNNELFGQLLTPVLAIDWQISPTWRLYGNFPMYNTLSHSLGERWNTGLHYIGLVTTFQGNATYIERRSLDFSWFLEYYITKQLVAHARFGYPVDRAFEEYADGDKADFTLSLFRFGDDREILRIFDEKQFYAELHLFFRMKK